MLSLMSVTVCAMALAFAVVFCDHDNSGKCPAGYYVDCRIPGNACPEGSLPSSSLCPQTWYCCFGEGEDYGCRCTLDKTNCGSKHPPKCQKCCRPG